MEYKKTCKACGKVFVKPYECSVKAFEERTKYCSKKCKNVVGEKNGSWKGENIQTDSVHSWICRMWKKPTACELCGTTTAKTYNWSNKDHKYTRNREDWQYVCKKCHHHYDMKHNGYKPASYLRKYWESGTNT